jgi:hypothetical protein
VKYCAKSELLWWALKLLGSHNQLAMVTREIGLDKFVTLKSSRNYEAAKADSGPYGGQPRALRWQQGKLDTQTISWKAAYGFLKT